MAQSSSTTASLGCHIGRGKTNDLAGQGHMWQKKLDQGLQCHCGFCITRPITTLGGTSAQHGPARPSMRTGFAARRSRAHHRRTTRSTAQHDGAQPQHGAAWRSTAQHAQHSCRWTAARAPTLRQFGASQLPPAAAQSAPPRRGAGTGSTERPGQDRAPPRSAARARRSLTDRASACAICGSSGGFVRGCAPPRAPPRVGRSSGIGQGELVVSVARVSHTRQHSQL